MKDVNIVHIFKLADLRAHKDNIHLKIKHVCVRCGFKASTRGNIIGNKKVYTSMLQNAIFVKSIFAMVTH